MKIYYAHSMHLYGKPQEQRDIKTLEKLGLTVVNPNTPEHVNVCKQIRERVKGSEASSRIMEYFVKVVSGCDAVAFRAHPDGKIPAGVGKEVKQAIESGKAVIELPPLVDSRFMSVNETRQYLELLGER